MDVVVLARIASNYGLGHRSTSSVLALTYEYVKASFWFGLIYMFWFPVTR